PLLPPPGVWEDARVRLPERLPERLRDVITGETAEARGDEGERFLPVADLLRSFPVALLADA
ncbi:hypothetical protein WAJ79_24565, partial [Acinetobacter baumannii]